MVHTVLVSGDEVTSNIFKLIVQKPRGIRCLPAHGTKSLEPSTVDIRNQDNDSRASFEEVAPLKPYCMSGRLCSE